MNLAILNYANTNRPGAATADGRHGIHHFGFRVADFKTAEAEIEVAGGTYCFDLGDPKGMNYERKFKDPEGILFDISEKGWYGALDEAVPEESARFVLRRQRVALAMSRCRRAAAALIGRSR